MATKKKKTKRAYKPEDLKKHHSKPYRKRHYGLLALSLISVLTLGYLLTSTSIANYKAVRSAKDLVSGLLGQDKDGAGEVAEISSAYGFSLQYNPDVLRASALDAGTKSLYVGSEISGTRAYSAIKITPASTDLVSETSGGSISVEYHSDNPVGTSADLSKLEAQLVGAKNPNFAVAKSSNPTVDGITLLKSEWVVSTEDAPGTISAGKPTLTSYTGVINNTPFTVVVNRGIAQSAELKSAFEEAIQSLSFQAPSPIVLPLGVDNQEEDTGLGLLDKLMMTEEASAASFLNKDNASEKVSLLYGASVVKIYNFYCMDVSLMGQTFVQQSCSASTGSGFFVGDQGHVATNGHVAVNDPLSIAITYAFEQLSKGNSFYFSSLAQAANLTQADLDAGSTNQDKIKIAVDKFYRIPSSQVEATNKTENILVGLGEQQPDLQKLLDATKYHQAYQVPEGVQKAELVDYNYRAIDGAQTGSFTASDVALLKVEESKNYPSTKLGDISSLMQGSGLSIIGYPGAASNNPLVEASESIATLTSGKVSSVKSASGSDNKLIETDATIGHGNSGGPAFNDSGEVVGIATYTIDGSGDGDGVFNYVRDVADLEEITSKNSISTSLSQTQQAWEAAVGYIYEARYSKAIEKLEEVQSLYPEHPRAAQLLSLAQAQSTSGEETREFPTTAAVLGSMVGIILLLLSILLIVHHSRKHSAYKEHVSAGNITPPTSLDQLHAQQSPPQIQNPPQAT